MHASPIFRGTIDDMYEYVDWQLPGFGGSWIDEQARELFVVTKGNADPALARAAQPMLGDVYGDPAVLGFSTVAVAGQYSFGELLWYRRKLESRVWSIAGVVSTDVHEGRNRVVVGATDPDQAREEIAALAAEVGVPVEAVEVDQSGGFIPDSSLTDRHRPLVGGLQIQNRNTTGLCSMSVAYRNGGVDAGFLTASHCTDRWAQGADDTVMSQPTTSTENRIGDEVTDPPFFTVADNPSCPAGRWCRESDAAWFSLGSGVGARRGRIADAATGSPAWGGATYRVIEEGTGFPGQGTVLFKVGKTTGETSGPVRQTCVNLAQDGTSIVMLCMMTAGYGNYLGDSGGPVFRKISGSDVRLMGLNQGYQDGTDSAVYSPLGSVSDGTGIRGELGEFGNCESPIPC